MEHQLTLLDGLEGASRFAAQHDKSLPQGSTNLATSVLPPFGRGCKVYAREHGVGHPRKRTAVRLTGSTATFGRHESFPLRFGWIIKGLEALVDDPKVFTREDATVTLGVGKNMVAAIRYWLQATRVATRDPKTNTLEPTPIAQIVFGDQGDPYLEDEGTIWLLHWLLATNRNAATAIYWFFNHFHKPAFTSAEVATALTDFAKRELSSRVSATTLKSDAQLVLRMYSRTTANARISLEDALDSPLGMLDLQERVDTRNWRAVPMDRAELPLDVFAFAIAELFEQGNSNQLDIGELMYSGSGHCAPGAVFRMTEEGLIVKLEALCEAYPQVLQLDRTAGVFQLYRMGPLDSVAILKVRYAAEGRLAA